MKTAIAISDIHGCERDFKRLLEKCWQPESECLLVLCGDYIDRGEHSLQVLQHICCLKQKYGDLIQVILGNHDQMLLDFWMAESEEERFELGRFWMLCGGSETLDSMEIYDSHPNDVHCAISKNYSELLTQFSQMIIPYFEWGDVLFVHAGIQPQHKQRWQNTSLKEFAWISDFYRQPNYTDKTIVFGHSITQNIHQSESNHIWHNKQQRLIGIDGACCFGGQLNAILINQQGQLLNSYYQPASLW